MEEDKYEYLSMVAMLYETGNWDEKTVIKRVESYAKDNNIDEKVIEEFLGRLIKKKEHSKEEKVAFLATLKFNNGELKYGDAVKIMTDDMVEKYYEIERKAMGEEAAEKLHDNLKDNAVKEESHENKVENAVEGEYSFKGGERTILNSNSNTETNERSSSNSTSQESQSSGVKSEPTTEQDFKNTANNMGSAEQDSNVRHVDASPERIERLKKNKSKVKQFFLKAGVVVLTVMLTSTFSIPLIGGYLVVANQIKNGKFNMPGAVGQGVKKVVEGIMNLGKSKEEIEEERGKTR